MILRRRNKEREKWRKNGGKLSRKEVGGKRGGRNDPALWLTT